eukprot:snap_masked-scaffold_3-processed-gene-17.10-mRNA-1 protein AED:1.00 eAED:1.00 QI:0/-1/0/0/-1/1/1/0/116
MKLIISDEPLALTKSTQDLGAGHVRCVQHLSSFFSSGAKGLRGADLKRFMDSQNNLMRQDLGIKIQFDEEMYSVMYKLQHHELQTNLKYNRENEKSMCWTFPKKLIFGYGSTRHVR